MTKYSTHFTGASLTGPLSGAGWTGLPTETPAIKAALKALEGASDQERLAVIEALEDQLASPRRLLGATAAALEIGCDPATVRRILRQGGDESAPRARVILQEARGRVGYGLGISDVARWKPRRAGRPRNSL